MNLMHRRTFPCRRGTVTQPRLGVSLERLQLESQAVPRYILPLCFGAMAYHESGR